ncbi:hypothetical protein NE865_10125 [Phthorimaea operculella]|nr:hypothetical protein NE865_10125 [Phthorimaea operculella]
MERCIIDINRNLAVWEGYKHRCDCLTPRTLCATQRKQLLSRISFFGAMEGELDGDGGGGEAELAERGEPPGDTPDTDDLSDSDANSGTASLGLSTSSSLDSASELLLAAAAAVESADVAQWLLPVSDSDNSGTASLGLSTSSSLDSASELLLAAAAAVESGSSHLKPLTADVAQWLLPVSDSDNSGTASLGLSTSSSLDSASELLLAAAAAVESGSSHLKPLTADVAQWLLPVSDSDNSGTASLGLSTSSSLDSASELLLAAAAAVESGTSHLKPLTADVAQWLLPVSDSGTASLGLSTSSSLDSASELLLAAAAAVESGSSYLKPLTADVAQWLLPVSDSDANSGTASLGLSTSSSLDSASELLLAAAAAVESGTSYLKPLTADVAQWLFPVSDSGTASLGLSTSSSLDSASELLLAAAAAVESGSSYLKPLTADVAQWLLPVSDSGTVSLGLSTSSSLDSASELLLAAAAAVESGTSYLKPLTADVAQWLVPVSDSGMASLGLSTSSSLDSASELLLAAAAAVESGTSYVKPLTADVAQWLVPVSDSGMASLGLSTSSSLDSASELLLAAAAAVESGTSHLKPLTADVAQWLLPVSDSGTASLGLSTSSSLDSASELLLAAAAAVESGSSYLKPLTADVAQWLLPVSDSDANSGTASLGLSTSSSLDSASELLLAAAAAVESADVAQWLLPVSDSGTVSLGLSTSSSLDSASELLLAAAAAVESGTSYLKPLTADVAQWLVPVSDSGMASLGLSTSSSLDSASELLLAAAAAVESGGSEGEAAPGELCRTVRHLMRSIASIERLMDRVLKHCDDWPATNNRNDHETRKRVDLGLSEVDRKLMAMYKRLPEVHRKQLQVYRKQKKLSTVCMQLVGGRAPAPPPPGSPPPAPLQPAKALCPEYHLQRFREVRRKVMHMRDQQLYYHRLRMWLEDQLRQERESLPDANMLKHKAPAATTRLLTEIKDRDDELKSEAEPPDAFPLERDDNISETETVVGEKETELCKDMKDCLAKFANFALSNAENEKVEAKYPESVSPPLQEMSPTSSESMPVYTAPKPSQRLLTAKLISRGTCETHEKMNRLDLGEPAQIAPEINIPLNAIKTPLIYKEMKDEGDELKLAENENAELIVETGKDPNIYKYVSFGIEIKKAMEECQNIINSYNSLKDKDEKDEDGPLSLEQICEVMMSLDKNAEFLDKIDSDEPIDLTTNTKLAELVENMPHILANMPEIASKLSEFANASFELPEFASIMNSLPDVNNEAQLTPETLKQIRELKLSKSRDNIKVTKNTAKRKTSRKIKNNIDNSDIIGTMTFELDSKDISELLKDEKELQNLMKNKSNNKEDFKDLLFSISAQVVINKVFEYLKTNKSPELAKCLEEDKDLFSLPKNSINSEMYSKASTLFDNSVKDAFSMDELRELVKSRFNSWKHYVATKFKSIPVELLDNEIEAMLDKFYSYIQDLAGKQCVYDSDKIIEKIDELRKNKDGKDSDSESCAASKESLKQITKLLSTSAGNTFDLLIMKLSKMSQDKKSSVKSLKFKYMDVIRRCAESQQLAGWILLDPEIAANVIQELTGLPIKKTENVPDFNTMPKDKKKDYFIERLREMNRSYMETLPKKALTGDEWLVMLYRLEQLEDKLKDAFSKVNPPPKSVQPQFASEAEILAAKGLSKIIGKANVRIVKKTEPPKQEPEKEIKDIPIEEKIEKEKSKNDALLAKCEAILTSKGEKSLLDSFYTIKSYITQGLPVPETYKKHVISICSSIDAKLLDEDIEETLKINQTKSDENQDTESDAKGDKANLSVIGSQNPELLAKYSAQALRNAKQTLNAVAFRNMMRNGQSKSESEACDTPKTDCKWTNDCICNTCKDTDNNSVCLGDIVKQCYDMEGKKTVDDKKKDAKVPAKPVAKPVKPAKCENTTHQQHVCKVGHTNGNNACAGDAGADQPCTCCYCTVFGHAPPLTTPVPRNFNETRERLRSILNKKKQKCKTNGEQEPAQQLADRLAGMAVSDSTDKPKALQRTVPVQVSVPPAALKTDGKVNANAMEQIRLQQLKQQQTAQQQQQQQQQAQQTQQPQQKKPEPIYDLPVHNKPTLTPQQQQQIRQRQQQELQRPQQRAVSLSSRDTSVFSTSSGCEGSECWRGVREDPRDLDALLQYIEGPTKNVDRGKKRAKKQRQKAKKLESKLIEEKAELAASLACMRREMEAMKAAHLAAKRRVEDVRKAIDQHKITNNKKGKKGRTKTQPAQVQQLAEQLGELTTLLNTAAKEVAQSEKQVSEYSKRLAAVEKELNEARAMQGKPTMTPQQLRKQAAKLNVAAGAGIVRVRRMPGDGAVSVSMSGQQVETPLQQLLHNNRHLTVLNVCDPPAPAPTQEKSKEEKKQTWEQALAHIAQLANSSKEKKKKEKSAAKAEAKKQQQRSASLPDISQPLSKKQRKLLAKQQAEEEERRKQQELEAKAKKEAKKQETAKQESKKQDKKAEKKQEPVKKKEEKQEKKEKKGKENKQEKAAPAPTPTQTKKAAKKEKKQQQQQSLSLPPDTTIELANSKNQHSLEGGQPASCSIMEQLSCGVSVQDLRLPPGITLTRVQPSEKKEPPHIKSVPLWKCGSLPAAPTPVARPPPVINADPAQMMFQCAPAAPPPMHAPEPAKTIIIPEPQQPTGKSKKSKKKAKKAATEASVEQKPDGTKMVTLRNPMFHPNLPPVQVTNPVQKKQEIRIPDPIPMPPNACQATITPTSNGMYTIRNPLMSMMHQQSMMGMRSQTPQMTNPMYNQQYNYVNPNVYNPVQSAPQAYVIDPSRNSPKNDEFQSRIMNLASFTQKNDEGYSLFKTPDDSQQRNFLTPEYFENNSPKPTVSPNPIGTRPNNENRSFDSNDSSLFANPIQRPEPIGTPLKREDERSDFSSLYTPFGQEDRNVFRNALFNDKNESNINKMDDFGLNHMSNGDPLPYFQRLRVGSKLNNEVTIHHVTESKFYKGQDGPPPPLEDSLFSRPAPPTAPSAPPAPETIYNSTSAFNNTHAGVMGTGTSSTSSPTAESRTSSAGSPAPSAIFAQQQQLAQQMQQQQMQQQQLLMQQHKQHIPHDSSVFAPDRSITNLSSLEVSEREIESFKRFEYFFEPPPHKPKVQLDLKA